MRGVGILCVLNYKNLRFALLLVAIIELLPHCQKETQQDDRSTSSKDPSAAISPTDEEILELLSTQCESCHGEHTIGSGGIDFILDIEELIEQGFVSPGNAEGSLLYQAVENGRMPPTGALSSSEKQLLKTWIDNYEEETEIDTIPTATAAPTSTATAGPAGTPTPTPTPLPGQALFATHCGGCHTPAQRSGRTAAQINFAIANEAGMSGVSVTGPQVTQIADYLATQ